MSQLSVTFILRLPEHINDLTQAGSRSPNMELWRCHMGVYERNQGRGKSLGFQCFFQRLIAPAIQLILDNPHVGGREEG